MTPICNIRQVIWAVSSDDHYSDWLTGCIDQTVYRKSLDVLTSSALCSVSGLHSTLMRVSNNNSRNNVVEGCIPWGARQCAHTEDAVMKTEEEEILTVSSSQVDDTVSFILQGSEPSPCSVSALLLSTQQLSCWHHHEYLTGTEIFSSSSRNICSGFQMSGIISILFITPISSTHWPYKDYNSNSPCVSVTTLSRKQDIITPMLRFHTAETDHS